MTAIRVKQLLVDDDVNDDVVSNIAVVCLCQNYARRAHPTRYCTFLRARRKKKYVCREVPTGRFIPP
jgi:hypothetical protein